MAGAPINKLGENKKTRLEELKTVYGLINEGKASFVEIPAGLLNLDDLAIVLAGSKKQALKTLSLIMAQEESL